MKVTRAQAHENRARVVAEASRLFRRNGTEAVGISELMRASGLTHGGFYKQFPSKEALVGEACRAALEHTHARWRAWLPEGAGRRRAFIAGYLSQQHLADAGDGCVLPALAAEAPRHGREVRAVFTDAIATYAQILTEAAQSDAERNGPTQAVAAPDRASTQGRAPEQTQASAREQASEREQAPVEDQAPSPAARRREALAALSQMVGAVLLARATDDPTLGAELLDAARVALGVAPSATKGPQAEEITP